MQKAENDKYLWVPTQINVRNWGAPGGSTCKQFCWNTMSSGFPACSWQVFWMVFSVHTSTLYELIPAWTQRVPYHHRQMCHANETGQIDMGWSRPGSQSTYLVPAWWCKKCHLGLPGASPELTQTGNTNKVIVLAPEISEIWNLESGTRKKTH